MSRLLVSLLMLAVTMELTVTASTDAFIFSSSHRLHQIQESFDIDIIEYKNQTSNSSVQILATDNYLHELNLKYNPLTVCVWNQIAGGTSWTTPCSTGVSRKGDRKSVV